MDRKTELLRSAAYVIRQYQEYASAMRSIGRGFEPAGIVGEPVDYLLRGIDFAVEVADVPGAEERATRP